MNSLRKPSIRIALFSIVFIGVFFNSSILRSSKKYDQYFYAVLDATLMGLETGEYRTIDRLYDLKEKSPNANILLVELMDYSIGAGGGEIRDEFIIEKGQSILPLLKKKKNTPLSCLPKYQALCISDIELRNLGIDWLISKIGTNNILRDE